MHFPFTDIAETTSKQWFHCQGGHATIHGMNIPNGILGTLKKKKKRKKSFCGCVCQAESHKSILFIIYKNTSTIFRREGTSSQEVVDHVQTPNLTLKWAHQHGGCSWINWHWISQGGANNTHMRAKREDASLSPHSPIHCVGAEP